MLKSAPNFRNYPVDYWGRQNKIENMEIEADSQPDPNQDAIDDYYDDCWLADEENFLREFYPESLPDYYESLKLDLYTGQCGDPDPDDEFIADYYLDKELYGWK